MSFNANKFLGVGAKVRVAEPMGVPEWSEWDDDRGRISPTVKRRLLARFFQGDRGVTGEIMYVSKESEREKLRRLGRIKVRIRDTSGSNLAITADPTNLKRAH